MSTTSTTSIAAIAIPARLVELLDEHAALTVQELASGCAQSADWVVTHVQAGVIAPAGGAGATTTEWCFASATLRRARRIAQLEYIYEADPQLAALAVDLMEEVALLRRRLQG